MGETSAIEWCDATFNPVIGCAKVSPACTNCYAETYAAQRLGRPELWRGERYVTSESTWGLPKRLDRKAAKEGRRLRLFVASLTDIAEDHPVWESRPWVTNVRGVGNVDEPWTVRERMWAEIAMLRHVDVLLLTKRIDRLLALVPREWLDAWPAHVLVGTTVEDQQRADERIPHLLRVPARVFVSYEPALGAVDFTRIRVPDPSATHFVDVTLRPIGAPIQTLNALHYGLSWVIAGGESGPKARPAHPDWFRSVRDQCAAARVPFLFKQWGEWAPNPAFDGFGVQVERVGKKAAGRKLDGRTHDGFPEVKRG